MSRVAPSAGNHHGRYYIRGLGLRFMGSFAAIGLLNLQTWGETGGIIAAIIARQLELGLS